MATIEGCASLLRALGVSQILVLTLGDELGKKHMMWGLGLDGELRKIPLDTTGRPWEEFAYQRIVQISWVVYRSDDSGPPGAPPGLLS